MSFRRSSGRASRRDLERVGFPRTARGLGYPVLPDGWPGHAWSPGTPDAIMMAVIKERGWSLPPDLQAKWDAAQVGAATSTPAVTASGAAISTQTGNALRLMSTIAVAPGVWNCVMSDGSSHYCDVDGNPISYSPPHVDPLPPVTTPAASLPTAVVSPAVTPIPPPVATVTPVAVTPAGSQISTTSGQPAAAVASTVNGLMDWLKGSLIAGVPNWMILGAGALFLFSGDGSSSSRRR